MSYLKIIEPENQLLKPPFQYKTFLRADAQNPSGVHAYHDEAGG